MRMVTLFYLTTTSAAQTENVPNFHSLTLFFHVLCPFPSIDWLLRGGKHEEFG